MAQWEGRSKGTRLGYRIFIALLKRGGVAPAYLLLYPVALYYFLFSWKSSKAQWYYFRERMGFSVGKSVRLLYRNYYLFGQTIIDRIVVMSGIPQQFSYNFDGEEHLHELVRQGKGGLLLSAHAGNWEIAGHLLTRLDTRFHIVMFDGENPALKEYLDSVTGERKANLILIKDDISHIYAINEALAKNELVCMHADRFVEGNKTLEANFLGEMALFPQGPFVLASRLAVPVCYVFAMKESNSHYHFFSSPPQEYRLANRQEGMEQSLKDFVAELEKKLAGYPAQWYNYYPFWLPSTGSGAR